MTKKSYNKFVATAATATLVASAIAPVAASADSKQFTDVNERYAPAVDYVVSKGVQGKTSTQFGVQDSIKRVDAAVFIANALDLNKPGSPDAGFSDVPARAKDAVNALKAKGIINGKTDTRYGANDVLTRGEVALILASAYNLKGDANSVKFTDVNKNRYGSAVAGLVEAGVTDGISDTKFGTENPVKRGDLAVFLYKLSGETPEVPSTDGITSVKAINDTTVEVKFGKEIDKDFIREAERNGEYFVVYTEGNSVESGIQSKNISFSSDGKSAQFDLDEEIESGKKYTVALLNGDTPVAADVVHSYGPTVLKEAASTPGFDVSAVSDKIYVKYSTKMKDVAKDSAKYTVYDAGGQELGTLDQFVADEDKEGSWSDLNDKKEIEFKLAKVGTDGKKQLSAGKTYKLVVKEDVKTDDNKTLAEGKRTITVKTPSVDEASPVAKVARLTGANEVTLYFDKDIADDDKVNLNAAQLDLRTANGKTVTVNGIEKAEAKGNTLTLTLELESELDEGTSYKIDMPANVVKNGVFPNAMNKATSGLKAEAQANDPISSMKAQIVANDKKNDQADLILTFDQVPVLDDIKEAVRFFDGRKEYKVDGNEIKVYGGDTSGKSVIIENIEKFVRAETNETGTLTVRGDKSYNVEIDKDTLQTASYVSNKAKNKSDLKASTKGISVAAPKVDEVRLESAEKIVVEFKEDIKGNVSASDIAVNAFVANRSDIFDGSEAEMVSGSGYYDVKVSGKTLTVTAKTGVKFVTGIENNILKIDEGTITNTTGKTGNEEIIVGETGNVKAKDIVDNAAPVIVGVKIKPEDDVTEQTVEVTYSESVALQGEDKDIAPLFFADKGENAVKAVEYNGTTNTAIITFDKLIAKGSTDLTKLTLKYTSGNTFYIEDEENNKMKTQTVTGFVKAN
ncbi:S-layer homology domain-containing protein [Savagea sp. SN6]|uniref:S-layer homology domain-containing protein n=1 Tax=Savagea serpentis TaxID=2785297 RepID=A0A8J7KEQ6_9BACL|nr:S-layer homology domain-containing protein [Savagea serpentis]MBF4501401.1 S-layer homology domain-containing protein [Savagea serpentis]